MDKKELFKTSSQNGVTMYIDKSLNAVVDMDVEDWVTEIWFNSNVEMRDCDKKFPNVKKLIIGPAVDEININNEAFSGVKYVDSKNTYYPSGKYLIYSSAYHMILKNIFSPDENDTIDMSFVNKIAPYAFYGCRCANLINLKSNLNWTDIEESAFAGSAFEEQPFVNGVKMVNHIVIDIDKDADKVILPDTMVQKAIFLQNVDLSIVKEMVIHNPDSIAGLKYSSNLPEKVTLEVDSYIRPEDILTLANTRIKNTKCIRKLSIKSPHYVEIDGIIYTKDMRRLIVGSVGLKHVEVPEGVEEITDFAFYNSEVESIKLPDSVKKIGDEAFSHCYNLKEINLGDGVKQLGNYVFSWDESLMAIELPSTIQEVGIHSFYKSGIKNIILNDGLKSISQNAFSGTHIEKLYIPRSVKHIGKSAISKNTKEIVMPVFLEDIVQGIRRPSGKINHLDHTSHIVRLQCGDKYTYLPRYVDISKFADLTKTVTDFFTDFCEERPELWKYAENTIDKEDLALLEYSDFNAEKAKQYLKKSSKKIALRLIENKNEENLVKLLKIDIVPKQLLEMLLEKAEEMPTARAYILEMLGNTKTNKSFSI